MSETAPSSGWLEGREHVLPVRIYYEDTDFTGAVYHANYLRYFERGRSDFLRTVGISHTALLEGPGQLAFTIVRMSIEFQRPARVDDALAVRTTYDRARGPRLFISQLISRHGAPIAQAQVEVACIDLAGRPKKPPAPLLATLTPLFAPPP